MKTKAVRILGVFSICFLFSNICEASAYNQLGFMLHYLDSARPEFGQIDGTDVADKADPRVRSEDREAKADPALVARAPAADTGNTDDSDQSRAD